MADSTHSDINDQGNPPQSGGRDENHPPSWLDGLPHNFSGWGPRTPDGEHVDQLLHGEDRLAWNGKGDHGSHYVWRFQRPRHH